MYLKEIKNAHSKDVQSFFDKEKKVKAKLVTEIEKFFRTNPDEKIDVEEIEGEFLEIANGLKIQTIDINGVEPTTDFEPIEFSDLAISDLVQIIYTINNHVTDWNKTVDRTK